MLSFGISWALSYFCATVWPTYASFKALQTPHPGDDTQWLTYWIVYSVLTTLESVFTSFVIWFPFYYELRLLVVLWLVLPQTKGAQLVFETYIKPLMKKYGATIDPAFLRAEQVMNSPQVQQAVAISQKYGPQIASQALQKAADEAHRLASGTHSESTAGHYPGSSTSTGPPGYQQPAYKRYQ